MPHSKEKGLLPDYQNPPVVETILGVQFERLDGFKNAHLGAFCKTLDAGQWPAVSDAPALEPQFERFAESARWARIGAQLALTQERSSRLQIKNKDGDRMIQVQNGRLHFNWLGQAGGKYRRYEQVREGLVWALGRETIVQSFKQFMTDSANEYWGLNDASNYASSGTSPARRGRFRRQLGCLTAPRAWEHQQFQIS